MVEDMELLLVVLSDLRVDRRKLNEEILRLFAGGNRK